MKSNIAKFLAGLKHLQIDNGRSDKQEQPLMIVKIYYSWKRSWFSCNFEKTSPVKIFLCAVIMALGISGYAQPDSIVPGYKRYPTIPPFTLLKTDSTNFTRTQLPKNRKTMFMFFSPGCDHCRHQTDSILAHIDKFKDVEIVLATYQPFEEMKGFYNDYKLARFSNIRVGRDAQYFFPPFYKISNLPFMILYNAKGKLITTFEGSTPITKVVDAFKTTQRS
jgi:thiol-disulfide isomerase/thioredoxin